MIYKLDDPATADLHAQNRMNFYDSMVAGRLIGLAESMAERDESGHVLLHPMRAELPMTARTAGYEQLQLNEFWERASETPLGVVLDTTIYEGDKDWVNVRAHAREYFKLRQRCELGGC